MTITFGPTVPLPEDCVQTEVFLDEYPVATLICGSDELEAEKQEFINTFSSTEDGSFDDYLNAIAELSTISESKTVDEVEVSLDNVSFYEFPEWEPLFTW